MRMEWTFVVCGIEKTEGKENGKEKDVGDIRRMAKPGYGKRRMPRSR